MVIIRTSAVEVIIQAVSPESSFGGGAAAWAKAGEASAPPRRRAARPKPESRVSPRLFMRLIP